MVIGITNNKMKKALLYVGIALVAIGCTKSEITESTPASGEISFSAGVATRVGSGDDDCTWASGDGIGIFTDQSGESNMKFTISNTSTGAMTAGENVPVLFPLSSDNRTYYAYHPYTADDVSGRFTINEKTITVDTDDDSTPLLWATTTTNDAKVVLQFTHMLPKVTFNLIAGGLDVSSDYDLTDATAWITGANTVGEFDLEKGEFDSEKYTNDETITLTIYKDNDVYTIGPLYLLPSSGAKLWINADNNTFIKTISDSWVSGSSYTYDITVGETKPEN